MSCTLPTRRAFAHANARLDTAVPDGLVLALRLGRSPGDSDADTRAKTGFNLAPAGPHGPAGRLLFGAPAIDDDVWTFTAGTDGLRFAIDEPATWCGYIVGSTPDTTPSGPTGCPLFGWYSGNDGFGSGLIVYSTAQYRLLAYQAGPATLLTASAVVPDHTMATLRCLYVEVTAGGFGIQNLTDGAAMVTVPFAAGTAYLPGDRKLGIGSFYQTYVGGRSSLHALRVFAGLSHSDATKAIVLAELRAARGALTF